MPLRPLRSLLLPALFGPWLLLALTACGGPVDDVPEVEAIEDDGIDQVSEEQALTAPAPNIAAVIAQIASTVGSHSPGTQVAIAVSWLPTGQHWSYNGDQAHVSASSAKFVWADAALYAHSHTLAEYAEVRRQALPTFQVSDNSAAGRLIDLAGGPNQVNHFTNTLLNIPVASLSLCQWSFDRTRQATNCSSRMNGNNFFTPNSAVAFLAAAWKGEKLSLAHRNNLMSWAQLSPRSGVGGWLGTQLPAAARTSMRHKAGWLPPGTTTSTAAFAVMNDIGIVTTPKGSYAVALLYAHGNDYWGKQRSGLEWSSCVIYHALAQDVANPFQAGCSL